MEEVACKSDIWRIGRGGGQAGCMPSDDAALSH